MSAHPSCTRCNHRSNRECPALGGPICSICCAKERNGAIACPATCGHNPFGTTDYDKWLEIESKWTARCLDRINANMPPAAYARILDTMGATSEKDDDYIKWAAATVYALNHMLTPRGTKLLDEWEQEAAPRMGGDERVLFRTWRDITPGIVEIQRVKDSKTTECVDLLDPGRGTFCVLDRSLVAAANRFDRFLIWLWHLPTFTRPLGSTIRVTAKVYDTFIEELCEEAHDDPSHPGAPLRQYLLGNLGDAIDILFDIHDDLRERMLSSLDIMQTVAHYRLLKPVADIQAVLDAREDFRRDDRDRNDPYPSGTQFYVWLRKGESKAFEDTAPSYMRHASEEAGVGTLGSVRLLPDSLEVETFGSLKTDYAKTHIVRILADMIQIQSFVERDLAAKLRQDEEKEGGPSPVAATHDEDSIPPDVRQAIMEKTYLNHYRTFLDSSIPALDGMTPRQAAKLPTARPKLVDLMKDHINGIERMEKDQGVTLSIEWVLKELGLDELL